MLGDLLAPGGAEGVADKAPGRPDGAANIPVTNCNDDGPGSLRDAVQNVAISGDTVDMTGLACSTITLTSGTILVASDDLTIIGPGNDMSGVTIDAGHNSEIFVHVGAGTLTLESMTVLNGGKYVAGDDYAFGGCVYSAGNVSLIATGVKYCVAAADGDGLAKAGGVFAAHSLSVLSSVISGNEARAAASFALAGGIYAKESLVVNYSWLHDNTASAATLGNGVGGAIRSKGDVTILNSTISANTADQAAGAELLGNYSTQDFEVGNTTIYGNYAYQSTHGSGLYVGGDAVISNCTITGNVSRKSSDEKQGTGLNIAGYSTTRLESSIVSANLLYTGANFLSDDIGVRHGLLAGGTNNLVGSSTQLLPADTIRSYDPGLGHLTSGNGGRTPTMIPLPGSPALNTGNNVLNRLYDQRGPGYPRVIGRPDIGAVESDTIFASGFESE
ncbi:MAG: choice-of-anchor Q domain-containing protein [Rhodanobacteraceae bacterium]